MKNIKFGFYDFYVNTRIIYRTGILTGEHPETQTISKSIFTPQRYCDKVAHNTIIFTKCHHILLLLDIATNYCNTND